MSKFQSLKDAIESKGWQVSLVEPKSEDWWVWEIWQLESVWSPVGFTVYATLELDAECGERLWPGVYGESPITENEVICVNISWRPLESRIEPAIEDFSLRPWQECIDGVVECIGRLRSELSEEPQNQAQQL